MDFSEIINKLERCPFCGSKAILKWDEIESRDTTKGYHIICSNEECLAEISARISLWAPQWENELMELMNKWNRRPCKQRPLDRVGVGDICRYKNDKNKSPFIITNIYTDKNGFGETDFFFDALCSDGSIIADGTLTLTEKVTKNNHMQELSAIFELIKDEACHER